MNTKKLIFTIAGVAVGASLLVAIFFGVIFGIVFYTLSNSQAAETAKTFLRRQEKLRLEIGEIKDFGSFVQGNINTHNADGDAALRLKVIGERASVYADVNLSYREGRDWRVMSASYVNEAGRRVELLNPYEPDEAAPPE